MGVMEAILLGWICFLIYKVYSLEARIKNIESGGFTNTFVLDPCEEVAKGLNESGSVIRDIIKGENVTVPEPLPLPSCVRYMTEGDCISYREDGTPMNKWVSSAVWWNPLTWGQGELVDIKVDKRSRDDRAQR